MRRDHGAHDRARVPHLGRGGRRDRGRTSTIEENRDPHNHVMRKHRDAAYEIEDAAVRGPEPARRGAARLGRGGRGRRAQRLPQRAGDGARAHRDDLVPDGLRHHRHRARLLARQVQGAGRRRADDDRQPHGAAGAADARLLGRGRSRRSRRTWPSNATIVGAPGLRDEHLPVFDVAVGERAISPMGHIKMMAAAQPFLSGAISKTVNLPESVSVEDIAGVYSEGWKLGPEGARDLPRRLEDGAGAEDRRGREEGRAGRRDAPRSRPARCGGGCRASASRSRTSSPWAATRATSPRASTRTARSARSS